MIFKRKKEDELPISQNPEPIIDSEFVNYTEIKKRKKINLKNYFKESVNNSKLVFINTINSSKNYFINNKYQIWKFFLAFFSVYFLIFSFILAFFPFSYYWTNSGVSSTISNFYNYNGSILVPSIAGIIYLVSFLIIIGLWIVHFFMYKKFEKIKFTKELAEGSKRAMAFLIIKYLSWGLLIFSLLWVLLVIFIPPNINANNDYLYNQELIHKFKSYDQANALEAAIQNNKITQEEIDYFFRLINLKKPENNIVEIIHEQLMNNNFLKVHEDSYENKLLFFNTAYGGVSKINNLGLAFLIIGAFFCGSSLLLFIAKFINNLLTHDKLQKLKINNLQFNFGDVRENILSINNKIKGIYNTSQQKYQDYKNKDTFRKYKKRLVEEGKDTNPDKFTTDVDNRSEIEKRIDEQNNESFFSILKNTYKDKVKKHDNAENYNNKKRMKPPKPEISIPDEELDEIIDSLDIK